MRFTVLEKKLPIKIVSAASPPTWPDVCKQVYR